MNYELAKWRMDKAEKTFQEGCHLLKANFLSGAVNRFYYAAFSGVRALLATKDLDASKHSGVISLFNKEFVKDGIVSKKASKTITKVFSERSHADYTDFKEFEFTEVQTLKNEVEELLDEFKKYLGRK